MAKVSVILCTYSVERFDYVVDCINSLKKQTLQPNEIILVLDKDKALLDFYRSHTPTDIKIIVSNGFGLSNARNAGVKNAEGNIVAFIDDDAIADEKWLENMVKNYEDPLVVGVGGRIEPLWESNRPIWFPEELDWIVGCSYKGLPERKTYVRNPIGCNMSFRRNVFEKVGYFKANIGRFGKKPLASEETEFSMRVLEKIPKSNIVYDPSSVVQHRISKRRANLKYVISRSFYEGFSKALIANSKLHSIKALSTENSYLRYLLKVATPSRLKQIYKLKNALQLLSLITSTFLVLVGYFIGRLKK